MTYFISIIRCVGHCRVNIRPQRTFSESYERRTCVNDFETSVPSRTQTWPELSPRGRSAGAGPTGRSPPLRSLRQPADRWSRRRPETSAPVTVRGCVVQSIAVPCTAHNLQTDRISGRYSGKLNFTFCFPSVVSNSKTRCR